MSENDLNNLNFLMSVSDEGFKLWFDQADDEDIQYAFNLIQEYRAKLIEVEIERRLENSDFSEAKTILEKLKA